MADLRYGTTVGGQALFHAGNTDQLLEVFNYKKPTMDLTKLNLTGMGSIAGTLANIPNAPLFIKQNSTSLGIDANEILSSAELNIGTLADSYLSITTNGQTAAKFQSSGIRFYKDIGIKCEPTLTLSVGDSNTGFRWVSDGRIRTVANGVDIDEINSTQRSLFTNLNINGHDITNAEKIHLKNYITLESGGIDFLPPTSASGWARGGTWYQPGSTSVREYGLGVLGSGSESSFFYIGIGDAWSNWALRVNKGVRNVDFFQAPTINGSSMNDIYQPLNSKLTAFVNSEWSVQSSQDLLCRGKRALVGTSTVLHMNYNGDFDKVRVQSELEVAGGLVAEGGLTRKTHSSGLMIGSYNNVGSNGQYTNPIYTIGSSYKPTDTDLVNMYGIGYASSASAPFLSEAKAAGVSNWGLYVVAAGNPGIFFEGSGGKIWAKGTVISEDGFFSRAGTHSMKSNNVDKWIWATGTNYNWGLFWDTGANQIQFRGNNVIKTHVDLDTGHLTTAGNVFVNNAEPYICLQDTTHRSVFMHYNVGKFSIARGTGTNSTTWLTETNPLSLDIETGDLAIKGTISEGGSLLSSKYLGISAKAADSALLNSETPEYWSSKRKSVQYIEVGGDADTYYPVVFSTTGVDFAWDELFITRYYSWTAPDTWYNSTHKGGLTFGVKWTGDGSWGGNMKELQVTAFSESYSQMVCGLNLSTSGLVVWLRGGGAKYSVRGATGKWMNVSIKYDGFTDGRDVTYNSRTAASLNAFYENELHPRMPIRGKASIYDNGSRVYSPNNIPSSEDIGVFDFAGSSEYPRLVTPSGIWVRVGTSSGGGLIPYTNKIASLGTSSWQFKSIYGETLYENGLSLSTRYLGKTSRAADTTLFEGYNVNYFLRRVNNANDYKADSDRMYGQEFANKLPVGQFPGGTYTYGQLLTFNDSSARLRLYAPHHEEGYSALYVSTGWGTDIKSWERILTKSYADSLYVAASGGAAPKVVVTNSTSNSSYPLVWHNNSNSLFDTVSKLTFNPYTGNLTVQGGVFANGYFYNSDVRLKESVKDLTAEESVSLIKGFIPKKYRFKESGRYSMGFLAHEVEELRPDMVAKSSQEEDGIKSVNYLDTIAPIVKSLQYALEEIEELKKEVSRLKGV
ncbi:hypothetical protein [Vibrio phage Va2]|nr:hypothetical protein [Vibrio phage Va2]